MQSQAQTREAMIIKYIPLVKKIAGEMAQKTPSYISYNELFSDGVLGLIDAIDRYDPSRGVSLKTYATYRIVGAILDDLRNRDWYPRLARTRVKKIEEARAAVEARVNRPAEDPEIAEELGISLKRYFKICSDIYNFELLRIDDFVKNKRNKTSKNTFVQLCISSMDDNPLQEVLEKEKKRQVLTAIKRLPEKQQMVICLYYYDNFTYKKIGDILGLTESRICQIHRMAVTRLKNVFK